MCQYLVPHRSIGSSGHDCVEAHLPLHPLAVGLPGFLRLLRCRRVINVPILCHFGQHLGSHPCLLALPNQSNADASVQTLAVVQRSGHHRVWISFISGLGARCRNILGTLWDKLSIGGIRGLDRIQTCSGQVLQFCYLKLHNLIKHK